MLSLKTDVNVPTVSNKQKNFCWHLESHWRAGSRFVIQWYVSVVPGSIWKRLGSGTLVPEFSPMRMWLCPNFSRKGHGVPKLYMELKFGCSPQICSRVPARRGNSGDPQTSHGTFFFRRGPAWDGLAEACRLLLACKVPMLNKNFCWCVSSSNTMLLWSSTVKFTSGRQCSVLLRNMMGRKLVLYYSEFVITATGMQYGMGPGMTDP